MSGSIWDQAGTTDAGMFGGGGGFGNTADPSAWSRIMNTLQSKEGQNTLATLGKGLTAAGAGDANYLRIAAGNAPVIQGVPPTLLLSLLQMQQQSQAAQLPQLGVPRSSLLG
jgi:hypothetical protein